MLVVDSHCHASDVWFEPVETLLFQMDHNGVAQAVLTQVLGQYDNSYQQACVARHSDRFVGVVAVDSASPEAARKLKPLAEQGARGVRLRPEARTPGEDPYAVWRIAAECGLAVSCGGSAANVLSTDFVKLVETFPNLRIVVEHLGGWARPDCDGSETTRKGIAALARFPNIYLKVPPLGQIVKRAPGVLLPPRGRTLALEPAEILLEMLGHFGADRLMWGSDFPPLASREGYANGLNWTRELFAGQPNEAQAKVFGGTARAVFGLPQT